MSQIPQPPQGQPPQSQPAPARGSNRCADAGFILGLISVVTFCCFFIAVPAAIAGLVLSIMGVARAQALGTGMFAGVAGFILSNFTLLVSTPLMLGVGGL